MSRSRFATLARIALTSAALTVMAAPASARDGSRAGLWRVGDNQIRLYYPSLNVNNATDRAILLKHVERAARRLCRSAAPVLQSRCVTQTIQETAASASGRMVARALGEREAVRLAAR